jgi:hypothetical protein
VSLPDVEALAVGQLLEDPMVSALADDRVGVDLPFDLTLVVIDSLKAMPAAQFDGAVVTLVSRVTGPRWSPDPPTDTPRYITDVVLYAHTVGG